MIANARQISNARMYAVSPAAEAAWQELLARVTASAGLSFDYLAYPAPQPLETLWRRGDLGCVFMCGYPIALNLAAITPIAAPVPAFGWAQNRPVYRSDLIVRTDSPFKTLADTFGGTAGWTVNHSHSGFNAFRHHLLQHRTQAHPTLYSHVAGGLVTARRILDSVLDGTIDIGPLDAYWHALIARYRPELTAGIRVIESTDVAPMPAFVASAGTPAENIQRLQAAFVAAEHAAWFPPLAKALLIRRFAAMTHNDYAATLRWDREAIAAGYPLPA